MFRDNNAVMMTYNLNEKVVVAHRTGGRGTGRQWVTNATSNSLSGTGPP